MKFEWFEAYVESLLRNAWDTTVDSDDDGDWPFRRGTAAGWVSARPYPHWHVNVFAHAATGLKQSARLLRELNDANSQVVDGRVYWRQGVVMVETTIQAGQVDAESLPLACARVGTVADDLGALLAAMFDGATPYPAELGA